MVAKGAPVTALKGIGPRSAEELRSLGILTAEDLLRFFPAGYDRPEAVTDIAAAPADVISETKYGLRMDHPKLFKPEEYESLTHAIWPVYPTMGVLSRRSSATRSPRRSRSARCRRNCSRRP